MTIVIQRYRFTYMTNEGIGDSMRKRPAAVFHSNLGVDLCYI